MPKNYQTSPNTINQDDMAFGFQDLKQDNPRVWQAITSLKSYPQPMPFYAEIILPGNPAVGQDVLTHPVVIRLPIDPYNKWVVSSILLQDVMIACKAIPTTNDFVADILVSRDLGQSYTSIFNSSSAKCALKANGKYGTKIEQTEFGTTEWFDDDVIRVDIVQTDPSVQDCWIVLRGSANFKKFKPDQEVKDDSENASRVRRRFR